MKYISTFVALLLLAACNNNVPKDLHATTSIPEPSLYTKEIPYADGNQSLTGFLAYKKDTILKKPAILIVHEWWGLGEYEKMRAQMLAKLGYVAFAIDMYGKQAESPDSAMQYAQPFYENIALARQRFEAALSVIKKMDNVDTQNIAAIGYCFGGTQVLNMARIGEPLKAVVSFHGGLECTSITVNTPTTKILVCNGAADSFVPASQKETFKKEMDNAKFDYQFVEYPDAIHAFTNPKATALGEKFKMHIAYNAVADTASWNDMKAFFIKNLN